MSDFVGTNLRLIRLFHDLSLTELGERVGVSKQFLSRVETGAESVAAPLENSLAEELDVLPEFFYHLDPNPIADEQCHFRRQLTTKVVLRQVARARGEMLKRLVGVLDEHTIRSARPIRSPLRRSSTRPRNFVHSLASVWGR